MSFEVGPVVDSRAAHQRTAGVGLASKPASSTPVPGSTLGYLEESDRSRWAQQRLAELLENVEVDLGQGACVAITTCISNESSVSASVTRKRGKRSLYYDVDVKCAWRAEWRGFDLSPSKDGPRPLEGSIRLYNVSHETRYEPGADPTDPASNEKWAQWRQRMDEVYGKAECIIGKQRHGPIGRVELAFDSNVTRFGDLTKEQKGYAADLE